jgi:hypothetical protein
VASAFCPRCGEPRLADYQFCRKCGLDFAGLPLSADADSLSAAPVTQAPAGWIVPPAKNAPRLLQPVHFLDDVRDFPRLVGHSFAVVLPVLLLLAIFGVFEVSGGDVAQQNLPALAFNWFIFPPPLIAPLVAGALANRSSYLAGAVVGLLAGVLFSIFVLTGTFTTSAGVSIMSAVRWQNVAYALISSLVAGLGLGGLGGLGRRVVLVVFG